MIQKNKKSLIQKVQKSIKYKKSTKNKMEQKSSVILKSRKKNTKSTHIVQFEQKSTNLGQESKSTNKYFQKYTKNTKKYLFSAILSTKKLLNVK